MESAVSTTFIVTPIMAYLGAWLSTCGVVWVLFSRGETMLSHDVKVRVRNALQGDSNVTGRVDTWPQQFGELFDAVFGRNNLSWRCLGRSSVASITAVFIMSLLLFVLTSHPPNYILNFLFSGIPILLLGGCVLLNVVQYYLSFLESRCIIKWMSKSNSWVLWLGLLGIDLILTFVIFVGAYGGILLIFGENNFFADMYLLYLGATLSGTYLITAVNLLFVFFYSTFFTSAWVWLYALSFFLVRLAHATDGTWNVLTYLIDIDQKPILSLGTISIVLITFGYLVASPFVLL